jgi:predicted nucleic acid-binding protein
VQSPLATNLALDQELLDRAFRVIGEPTKKAAVTRALQEFIARHALLGADQVFTTGLVLQELLQGFAGPKDRVRLVESLSALAFLQSVKGDHLEAAEVRNSCRRRGVPNGTMDALLIQLCRGNDLTLLTTDQDFHAAARHVAFSLWGAS